MNRTISLALAALLALGTYAHADVVTKTGVAGGGVTMFDGPGAVPTVTSVATFAGGDFTGSTTVTGVTVTVNLVANVNFILEEWSDLEIDLLSPTGTTLRLLDENSFSDFGPSGGVAQTWTFVDGGTVTTAIFSANGAMYDPDGAAKFAGFNTETALGNWTLSVTDKQLSAAVIPGALNSFMITITTDPIPEPGTAALLGLGLFGLVATRRRRASARARTV